MLHLYLSEFSCMHGGSVCSVKIVKMTIGGALVCRPYCTALVLLDAIMLLFRKQSTRYLVLYECNVVVLAKKYCTSVRPLLVR